ncbi:MAG: CHASE2 domain-containing protein, partial [Candidatus Aenigmatarchaeota archaeon]
MLHKLTKNKLLVCLLASLVSFFLFSGLLLGGVFRTWQLASSDALYSGGIPSPEIVIIAIDDKSLQELGRWPWDRALFAQALERLAEAKVVGIDVSFFEPSDDDQALQAALSERVVLPVEYTSFSSREGKPYGEALLKPVFTGTGLGAVNLFTDPDGITRSFTSPIEGVESHKVFALVVAEKYLNREIGLPGERVLVNFYGGPGSFQTHSFADLAADRLDASFKNKIVLIGATSPDLHDEAYTP